MSLVTLTFDNGPTAKTTPAVLEHLHARNLTAYFCVVGLQLQASNAQVDIAKETLSRDHILVNHSFTHDTALGDDPSLAHARREVTEMDALLSAEIGDWGPRWFRPFGRGGDLGQHIFSPPAVCELQSLGYSVLLWNSVPRDWVDPTGWVETALRTINSQEHTVLVLHDLNTGAMEHLPKFLDALLEQGHTVTKELPRDCVPMMSGEKNWPDIEFDELVSSC